jgi:hypothetical protein
VEKGWAQRRFNICKECPSYVFNFFGGKCKNCGCVVRAKVSFKSQECPIGKW